MNIRRVLSLFASFYMGISWKFSVQYRNMHLYYTKLNLSENIENLCINLRLKRFTSGNSVLFKFKTNKNSKNIHKNSINWNQVIWGRIHFFWRIKNHYKLKSVDIFLRQCLSYISSTSIKIWPDFHARCLLWDNKECYWNIFAK